MQRSIFSRGVRKGLEKLLVAELQEKDDTQACWEEGLGFLVKNLKSLLSRSPEPSLLTGAVI